MNGLFRRISSTAVYVCVCLCGRDRNGLLHPPELSLLLRSYLTALLSLSQLLTRTASPRATLPLLALATDALAQVLATATGTHNATVMTCLLRLLPHTSSTTTKTAAAAAAALNNIVYE